jgi:hypothetical protein
VTSDSIAARVAEIGGASRLILLKSTDLPDETNWHEAARGGFVDAMFPKIVQRSGLMVSWIHFRALLDAFPQVRSDGGGRRMSHGEAGAAAGI